MYGLRCILSAGKHFLYFVEAAYIPSAALDLFAKFALAFLTPGGGRAGPLGHHLKVDSVLKGEVKCGSVAFKRGLGYFKHNTSFKVKRLNCDTL